MTPLLAALVALLAPGGAAAATVDNGDFESGTLNGWSVREATGAGNWFAYKGVEAPIGHRRGADPVQPPPRGTYAAIADQANPDTLILYQDLTLEPGSSYQLSLLAYYDSYEPIAIPTPDTLSVDDSDLGGQANQQFRIDLVRPGAPIESLDPADILRTLFETKPGAPETLPPTRLTANLAPFAGQTVRLRIANAVHEEVFNAGVDAVSLSGAGLPGHSPPRGSSRLSLGRVRANRKTGTAVLPVQVPAAGVLTAAGTMQRRGHGPRAGRPGRAAKAIRPVVVKAARAGTVSIHLVPTRAARAVLEQKHRLRVRVAVGYEPADGPSESASVPVVLRLEARSHGAR